MEDFRLEKWYFDCVDGGNAFIGYAAKARWGGLRVSYGALISSLGGAATIQRQTLSAGEVRQEDHAVHWANDALGVSGSWREGARLAEALLIDEGDGEIRWHCLATNAIAEMTVKGRRIEGVGYAERLTTTIPPTRLPFTELRWGRFISQPRDRFMVWIDMRGDVSRTWTWANTTEPCVATIEDDAIVAEGCALHFGESQSMLEGNVARDTLGVMGFLAPLLPRGLRRIEQHKRVGECTLSQAGVESLGGAIYEVVRFG